MTETAAPIPSEHADYLQAWADALSHVLGQITGAPVPCTMLPRAPAELASSSESDLWTLCTGSGALRGEISLRMNAASTLRTAQIFMSEPAAPDAPLSGDHREAVVEFLRQVAGIVASSLKARWGEVQLQFANAPGPASWPASSTCWLQAGAEDATVAVEIHLSAALAAALRADKGEAVQAAAGPPASLPAGSTGDGKLDLLMDVELSMTLRFGGRQLLLREVLELSPGSVVELDRQVQDPVDLLLDGRLVARGEVVVVDGNYGLRVTEVVQGAV